MSAGLRCVCHDVTYTSVSAYLADHVSFGAVEVAGQLSLELEESASRHPSTYAERYVGTFYDGSQLLVEVVAPGKMTAAVRSDAWSTWGPPTFLDEAP